MISTAQHTYTHIHTHIHACKYVHTYSKKKSVPWWTESLTIMRKRLNACRRLYHRTRNDEEQRERRKQKYLEEKRKYQAGMKKEKFNSWTEYSNVAASTNPWSQVYKLAARKTRANSIMTTLNNDHLFTEDGNEETLHHKNIRKAIEEPICTCDDLQFSREEINHTIESFNDKKAPGKMGSQAESTYEHLIHSHDY